MRAIFSVLAAAIRLAFGTMYLLAVISIYKDLVAVLCRESLASGLSDGEEADTEAADSVGATLTTILQEIAAHLLLIYASLNIHVHRLRLGQGKGKGKGKRRQGEAPGTEKGETVPPEIVSDCVENYKLIRFLSAYFPYTSKYYKCVCPCPAAVVKRVRRGLFECLNRVYEFTLDGILPLPRDLWDLISTCDSDSDTKLDTCTDAGHEYSEAL